MFVLFVCFVVVAYHPSWTKCLFFLLLPVWYLKHSGCSMKNKGVNKREICLTFEAGETRSRKRVSMPLVIKEASSGVKNQTKTR